MSDRPHVLVLGLGETGLAMARWLVREGHAVRVADTRAVPPMLAALRASHPEFDVRLGAFDASLLADIDQIAISPGLSPDAPEQASLLAAADERSIPLVGEIELFAQKLAELKTGRGYAPRIVAITGTNGKTTVTKLVGRICAAAGKQVAVAGNVSPAALDALSDALERDALPEIWVLELSSFQLATTRSLVADSATVLNVTQDHLDWHGDFDAYAAAKASVFATSTVRLLNRNDARVMAMDAPSFPSLTFGLDEPQQLGDYGVIRDPDDGLRWLAVAEADDPDVEARGRFVDLSTKRRGRIAKAESDEAREPARVKRLMPVDALQLRGDHNIANVLAAIALARAIGIPMAAALRAVGAYRGEPHRMAFVAERDGVDWIDDSKGTNVGATVAALRGLGKSVVLIAGGLGKGQDFTPLAEPVARHARAVILIGRDGPAIRAALASSRVPADLPIVDCETLDDAVAEAARLAESGDAVLLSPACASQDMFRDYAERAERFVAAVRRLPTLEAATC